MLLPAGAAHAGFFSAMLCAALVVFLLPLKRRASFWPRLAVCLALGGGVFYLLTRYPVLGGGPGILGCFCLVAGALLVCCAVTWQAALYCGVWALVICQLTAQLWLLGAGWLRAAGAPGWGGWLLGLALFGAVYGAVGLTIARWMPENGGYRVGPRQLSSALVLLVLFELLAALLLRGAGGDGYAYSLALVLAQLYCVTMLYLQQALFRKSAMQQELDILNRLGHEQKQQYAIARDTIALINRKCHDLKHQVAAMRHITEGEERERYLREIEDSVRIYEAIVQTGNEVLDTVLTEKSLYCEANQITVHCVADGRGLEFIAPVDIYAMLGNALDNAIENVQRFSRAEKRFIDVLISRERQFLVIQVLNPLEGRLTFEDGLPRSTKPSDGFHGFGLKSIRHTAKQYGGSLLVEERGGCFCLKIVIPIPE